MWIKSQNGDKLVDCYEFYIRESMIDGYYYEFYIRGTRIESYCYIYSEHGKLGTYKSREQAEKVLSNIENSIMGYCSKYYDNPYDCPMAGTEYHGIFAMPSIESEV